jgi:AraC-like DNA-binding protein
MKGTYITDNISTAEQLNKAFESIFKGSTFECKSFDNNISSVGEGIVTEDFFTGNFIGDNISSIRGTNLNDCVISMPRLGHFDTKVSNKTIYNKAHETGNILIAVDEALYNNPSKLVNNYMVIINYHELMNMLENKFGISQLSGYLREIHLADEKVKALFYYIGSTIHVIKTFASLRESLVAKMNIKEITLLMATDLIGDIMHKKSLLNESPDKKLVLKAEEIMESQCENITTIQEISDKVYTSPRNLQKAFKKHRSYSPLQFLKEQKLLRANHILNDLYIQTSVKNVAISVGIFDINRFGKYYFDRFGELPSETLKKKGNF